MTTTQASSIARSLSAAFDLDGDRLALPEPYVKQLLAKHGIGVPVGVVVGRDEDVVDAVRSLRGPFALKAWGPGIVHKNRVGAVAPGVARIDLANHAAQMLEHLDRRGLTGSQLYVEEMAIPGTELLFGVIDSPPFGPKAVIGLGGTLTEVFDDVVMRLCPLTLDDCREMVGGFRGAALLPENDRARTVDSLVSLMLAIAGPGGFIEQLGLPHVEFEINPLIVSPSGLGVADARLIYSRHPDAVRLRTSLDLATLTRPRTVAVVGASSARPARGNMLLRQLRELGWTDKLYAIHPSASEIDGCATFPSLAAVPGGVDHAILSVPADECVNVLAAARGTVRTATVGAAGFAEEGPAGTERQHRLLTAGRDAGVRFLGPNCLGVHSPAGQVSFSTTASRTAGSVSVIVQSGGIARDCIALGERAGMQFASVISVGNAIDIGIGELARHMVADPSTGVLGIYLEGGADADLLRALRAAKGQVPSVCLLAGLSAAGARTAASHTGALTTSRREWQAVRASTGCSFTTNLDEFVATLSYLDRYANPVSQRRKPPSTARLIVLGVGGGASVLAVDEAARFGLPVHALTPTVQDRLAEHIRAEGANWTNPIDVAMYQFAPPRLYAETLRTVVAGEPVSDALVHIDIATYYSADPNPAKPGLTQVAEVLDHLADTEAPAVRLAFVARNLSVAPGADADALRAHARQLHIPLYTTFGEAFCAIAAAWTFDRAAIALTRTEQA